MDLTMDSQFKHKGFMDYLWDKRNRNC